MKTSIQAILFATLLMAGCTKEEKTTSPTAQTQSPFSERGTIRLTSRISATETVTLAITNNPNTGAVTVTKSVNTAVSGDEYNSYVVGMTPTISIYSGTLTIPQTGSYYFIPFDDTPNAISLSSGAVITYSCECCATCQSGGSSNCTLTGTISGGIFTVACTTSGCEECGLNATERARNKTGVYLPATGVTISQ